MLDMIIMSSIMAHVWEEGMSVVEVYVDLESRFVTTPTNFIANASITNLCRVNHFKLQVSIGYSKGTLD